MELTLGLHLACVEVLLLAGPRVLEPHLSNPLTEASDLCDALQVLAVRVRVQLEVCLQYLQLLLCERSSNSLRFVLVVAL